MADREVYITTADNPYDPRDNYDQWYAFDTLKGHNTCSYLARIAKTSDAISDRDNEEEIERAIDEIVSYSIDAEYKKIVYIDGKKQPNP